jgi:hypothetical protein
MASAKPHRIVFTGRVVDFETGQKIHESRAENIEDFEEWFTKPMREKLGGRRR